MAALPAKPAVCRLTRRKTAYRFLAIAVSVGIACALGELGLRVTGYSRSYVNPAAGFYQGDPRIGWRGRADFAGRFATLEFNVTVAHNHLGFRRQEHQHAPAHCRHKVFVLGDSFTWGWGVDQGKVYTDQMNLLMPDCDVENFGMNGVGTVQEFAIFEGYVSSRLSPGDAVVLTFCNNDFDDNINQSGSDLCAEVRDGRVCLVPPTRAPGGTLKNTLKEYSYLFNLTVYCWDLSVAKHMAHKARLGCGGSDLADDAPRMIVARHFLGEFQKTCQEKGASFVVVYIPGQAELGEAAKAAAGRLQWEQTVHAALRRCVQSLDIDMVNLLPDFLALRQSGRFDRFTFAIDQHWNENGHRAAAESISHRLLDRYAQQAATETARR